MYKCTCVYIYIIIYIYIHICVWNQYIYIYTIHTPVIHYDNPARWKMFRF